jgi:hypothetical protein
MRNTKCRADNTRLLTSRTIWTQTVSIVVYQALNDIDTCAASTELVVQTLRLLLTQMLSNCTQLIAAQE